MRDEVVVQSALCAQPPGQHPARDLLVGQVEVDDPVDVVPLEEEFGLARRAGKAVDDEAEVPVVIGQALPDDRFDKIVVHQLAAVVMRFTWAPSLV